MYSAIVPCRVWRFPSMVEELTLTLSGEMNCGRTGGLQSTDACS